MLSLQKKRQESGKWGANNVSGVLSQMEHLKLPRKDLFGKKQGGNSPISNVWP